MRTADLKFVLYIFNFGKNVFTRQTQFDLIFAAIIYLVAIFHVTAMIDSVRAVRHNSKLLDNRIRFAVVVHMFGDSIDSNWERTERKLQ